MYKYFIVLVILNNIINFKWKKDGLFFIERFKKFWIGFEKYFGCCILVMNLFLFIV